MSGTLDGVAFSARGFLFTATGDTDNRLAFNNGAVGYSIDNMTTTVTLSGLGTFTLMSPTRIFVNNTRQTVGLSRAGISGSDLLNGPTSPMLGDWAMLTSTTALVGQGRFLQWFDGLQTTGGRLSFNTSRTVETFRATVAPLPASAGLLGAALAGLVAAGHRCGRARGQARSRA